jgi:hypothetical protein
MANTIILKRSSTAGKTPTTAQLALGEIAINTHDGKIFIKKDNGVPAVVEIGGVTSVNTQTGDVVLTSSDVAEGSNQYFTTGRARSAVSAGTGISYNSGTGVISTSQNISTAGTPTFAGLTVAGTLTSQSIVPSSSNTYDLGTAANPYRHIFVGPGSLYVNGKQVLTETSGTMTFTADLDQNMRITTTGTGLLQLGSSTTGVNIDGTMQIAAGKRITSSDGVKVQFGDDVELNGNKVIGLGTPTATSDAATKGYVDSTISAISTSTISQGNSNIAVVDNGTGSVTVTVDGSTALTVDASGVVIAGNMTVNGTTTTVNSNAISLADNIITLNSDWTGPASQNAGVEVNRGDDAKVSLRWNEGLQKWTFTNDGAVYTQIATSTDTLAEGTTNLFHTAGRARTALSASTSSGISYNSTSGLFSLGSIPNSSLSNNSITINGSSVALGGSRTLGTDDVAEGVNNQYFTTARARSSISVGGNLAYNSTTGVISYTTPTTIASLSNHTTTALAEGTNLYFTDARAVAANASAVSGAITTAAADATSKVANEATARDTAISVAKAAAIATAASDATAKVAAEAVARDAAIAAAVQTKDNTDEITEGTTNLYFTTARARAAVSAGTGITVVGGVIATTITQYTDAMAVSANASAVSGAISTAAADATSKVAAEASARATAVTAAIATAASDATSKVAAEATARDTAIASAIATEVTNRNTAITAGVVTSAGKLTNARTISGTSFDGSANITLTTTGITEGTNLYFTDARVATRVSSGLTHFHATFQTVTSAEATTNATGTVSYTFSDLATAKDYNVFLNRMLLRPTEFSVSGSTLTVAIGMLATGDEIEVSGLKFA